MKQMMKPKTHDLVPIMKKITMFIETKNEQQGYCFNRNYNEKKKLQYV